MNLKRRLEVLEALAGAGRSTTEIYSVCMVEGAGEVPAVSYRDCAARVDRSDEELALRLERHGSLEILLLVEADEDMPRRCEYDIAAFACGEAPKELGR